MGQNNTIQQSFFFGPKEVKTMQEQLPPQLRTCSTTFELITACVRKYRTIALELHPDEIIRLSGVVREAQAQMSEEYMRSVMDFMVLKGRPLYNTGWNYIVTDINSRIGYEKVDFGWGKLLLVAPTADSHLVSFFSRFTNTKGEDGIVVAMCLPLPVMGRFQEELEKMTREFVKNSNGKTLRDW
ncbi:hypothetical protein L1049_026134 [Liquidambar formosana]|uniref:Uncharacterized protein n=1 Tax=Liquidambar formosana TaxID=63359 RepID=A0AAP0R779_LIQFO